MAIRSNYPDILPTLSLDFANTRQLDPRITFTRTTTATYYDGKTVTKAEQNLLLQSQTLDNASWTSSNITVSSNSTSAPDGTNTAETLTATASNGTTTQEFTAFADSYTFSVYIKRKTGTGDIDITCDSGGTWVTQTITSSWARYTVTQTLAEGIKNPGIRVATNTDEVYVWGAQIEQRSSATAYTATTTQPITNYIPTLKTAAAGQARFDNNPTTGESLGFLIEESRTNSLLQSADFSTTWTSTRATVNTNNVVSPDGTLTADQIIASTDNNTHFVTQTFTGTAASYTFSVYAKAFGYNFIVLRLYNGTSQVGLAYYNLSTGATGTVTAGTATITSVGNSWYRCTLTATLAASASCTADIYVASADNTNSFAGDDFDGVTVWGAQCELGSFATSYIPTTSATVTRNADNANMTGTNISSWYNPAESTLYAEHAKFSPTTVRGGVVYLANITASASSNDISLDMSNGGQSRGIIEANGTIYLNKSVGAYSLNIFYKTAIAATANNANVTGNGASAGSDTTTVVLPLGVNNFAIGAVKTSTSAVSNYLNGQIKKISYYPKRLSNTELQALTSV